MYVENETTTEAELNRIDKDLARVEKVVKHMNEMLVRVTSPQQEKNDIEDWLLGGELDKGLVRG